MKTPDPVPATERSHPRTRAGWRVRSLLIGAPEPRTGGPLKRISASLGWLSFDRKYRSVGGEALAVLVRRRFATRPDREIVQYAEEVILYTGRRAGDGLARAIVATIKAGTGRVPAASGIGSYTRAKAQFVLLRDLTREMAPDEVDEIIAFAEVCRERQSAGPAAIRAGTGVGRAGPTTLAGQRLRAIFTDGRDTPDDPRGDDAVAVLDCLFELAMQRRFRSDYDVHEVTRFIQLIAERYPREPPVSFTAAEAMVRSQLGEPLPVDDSDRGSALAMKSLASRAAVMDVGLLDRELDELLVEAEHRARERGFEPTPAPPSEEQAGEQVE